MKLLKTIWAKHRKLSLIIGVPILLVVIYFGYKYTYIFTERRKYNTASVAIKKVAVDLRSQGIETEFTKGCSRNIEVYGPGSINCSVGITYKGDKTKIKSPFAVNSFLKSMDSKGFKITRNALNIDEKDVTTGFTLLTLKNTNIQCVLQYDDNKPENTKYSVLLSCNDTLKYNIF